MWGCSSYAQSWKEAKAKVENLIELGQYAFMAQFEGPKLVENFPEKAEAHYLYSYALYLTGNFAEAKIELNEGKALVGNTSACYFWLEGLLEAANSNTDKALSLLEKAYKLEPSYVIAMDIGRTAWQQGDYRKALEAYQRATSFPKGKENPWAYINQAKLFSYQGLYNETIIVLQNLLDLLEGKDGGDFPLVQGEVFYLLGQAYEELGDLENARINYETSLNINPNHSLAARALIRLADTAHAQ